MGRQPFPCVVAMAATAFLLLTPPAFAKSLEPDPVPDELIQKILVHSKIKAVRRIGLMFAFDFDSEERVNSIVNHAKANGVICYWFLSHPNSFRIAPPLTISEKEIVQACTIILQAIDQS